jgi:hypothetical protein
MVITAAFGFARFSKIPLLKAIGANKIDGLQKSR